MHRGSRRLAAGLAGLAVLLVAFAASAALAQSGSGGSGEEGAGGGRSLLEAIHAGGPVGYLIILLSIAGLALAVDGFFRIRHEKLVPPSVLEETERLAQKGRFSELRGVCRASDSLWGRLVGNALAQSNLGIDAVREALQQEGQKQFTRLHQRVGYIGLIASIAPLLGLLGTVTGMIQSFRILGEAQGAARADELAVGISEALVTTCMGLVVAVPLMFLHACLRDRVTQIGQETAAQSERLVRIISVVHTAQSQQKAVAANPSRQAQAGPPTPGTAASEAEQSATGASSS